MPRRTTALLALRVAHQLGEAREQIVAVARAGGCFRMVLHRENWLVLERHAAVRAVEQRHMRFGHVRGQRRAVDGEAVVHGGDLDLAGDEVLYRMIGAVMTLMHLRRLGADRDAEHLVAQADAEGRDAAIDDVADDRHGIFARRRRVARAVGEENAVRLERKDVLARGLRGHDRDLAALAGELAQNVALDAVVDGHHVELRSVLPAVALVPFPRRLVPSEALTRRHHRHQIHAVEPRPRARFLLERLEVEPARRLVRDYGVRHAVDPNSARERAGVDAGYTDDAARLEPLVEVAGRAVIRGLGDRG